MSNGENSNDDYEEDFMEEISEGERMDDSDVGSEDKEEKIDESDEEMSEKSVKTRKSYSLNFKKEVMAMAQKTSIRNASKKFDVSRGSIRDWLKRRATIDKQIESSGGRKKRLEGAGRHISDKQFDDKLISWIKNMRKEKKRVSRRSIQKHALKISSNASFTASNGWLEKFLKRHKLTTRKPTTICQKPPENYESKLIDFLLYVEKLRKEKQFTHIFSCDETAVYIDSSNTMTVEEKGAKQVSVRTTGHDKLHITVMLCAREDGYKCRPFVILPNKRPIPAIVAKYRNRLELCWEGRTFFNDSTTKMFLEKVIGNSLFGKRLLVWDSYRCHLSTETKQKLKELKIDTAVIPGGTTKFIQAPDVFWNGPFKAKVRQQYEDWFIHGDKSFTSGGNMRAPSMDVYLDWIWNAWNDLSTEYIIKSFKGCGLGPNLDGSDDEHIHCFKKDGELPNGISNLAKRRTEIKDEEMCELIAEVELETDDTEQLAEDSDASVEFD